jgi:hypothetical protein
VPKLLIRFSQVSAFALFLLSGSVPLALPVPSQIFLPIVRLPIQFGKPLPPFHTQQSIPPATLAKPAARNLTPFHQCHPRWHDYGKPVSQYAVSGLTTPCSAAKIR